MSSLPKPSDHVETLRKVRALLQSTPELQGREHITLGIAFNEAIEHFAATSTQGVVIHDSQM